MVDVVVDLIAHALGRKPHDKSEIEPDLARGPKR